MEHGGGMNRVLAEGRSFERPSCFFERQNLRCKVLWAGDGGKTEFQSAAVPADSKNSST
jgi:hypothetical protein